MPTKTQALVIREKDAPFKLEDVELADPTDNEVLVEVSSCRFAALHVVTLLTALLSQVVACG